MGNDQDRDVDYVHAERDQPAMRALPGPTRQAVGESLSMLQRREPAVDVPHWKPLHNFGSGVGELKHGKWRVVLSIAAHPDVIWIVCVFPKDSKSGSKMTKQHTQLIESSLKRLGVLLRRPSAPTKH